MELGVLCNSVANGTILQEFNKKNAFYIIIVIIAIVL